MTDIQFDTISNGTRKPGAYIEFNTRLAVNTLPGNTQKMVIIAPMLDHGTATPLTPVTVTNYNDAEDLFGDGSLAAAMVHAAIRANSYLQLDVVGVRDEDAGIQASGSIAITGTATRAGTITLLVGGVSVSASVAAGDTASTMLSGIRQAMSKTSGLLVSTVFQSEGTALNIIARNKGEWGNELSVSASTTVTGINITVTPMAGGEINADLEPAFDAVFAAGHDVIAVAFNDIGTAQALGEHLDRTGNAIEQRGAVGCIGWTGSLLYGADLAWQTNNGRITMPWYRGASTPPALLAAAYCAVIAGEEDPARPLNTLELVGLDVVGLDQRLSRVEQENALQNGLTPIEVGPGNAVQIVRAVSTYTRNAMDVTDISLLDITSIRTLDYVRKACRERILLRFPREKNNDRTRQKVRSELLDVLLKLESAEIVENVGANKDGLIVQVSSSDPTRINCVIPCDVVNGLHVFAARIDMIL